MLRPRYVLKEAEEADLLQAVRSVAAGLPAYSRNWERVLSSPTRRRSQRGRDVLRLLALGHTNAAAAERLRLSVRTVETHRANIQAKLGTTNRADLVRHALGRSDWWSA